MNTPLKVVATSRHSAEEIRELRFFVADMIAGGVVPELLAAQAELTVAQLTAFTEGGVDVATVDALDRLHCRVEAEAFNEGFVLIPSHERIISAYDRARAPRLGLRFDVNEDERSRGIALIYPIFLCWPINICAKLSPGVGSL